MVAGAVGGTASDTPHSRGNIILRTTRARALAAVIAIAAVGLAGCSAATPTEPNSPQPAETAAISADKLLGSDPHTLATSDDDRVTIVEFADYQCPPCGALSPVIEQIASDYDGAITLAVRNFPLDMHPNAPAAARAAEAAAKQGAFEGMYAALFAGQSAWSDLDEGAAEKVFAGYAKDLGIDMDVFEKDRASDETTKRIETDLSDGMAAGVRGTPTLYINGVASSSRTADELSAEIDALLGK